MSALGTDRSQRTGPSDPSLRLPESLRPAVQHIRLLQNKRQTLTDALVGAELQFLAALRRECDAGQPTWRELRDAYATLAAGRLRGLEARWMDAIGVSPEKVVANAKWEAIGAGEVWTGHWPLHRGETFPPTGQCVVYVLFDADTHPIYVRGTNRCSRRFADHHAHRTAYSSWMAQACVDRAEASELEARCRYQLKLNRQWARA
jgi:hypothetical protein